MTKLTYDDVKYLLFKYNIENCNDIKDFMENEIKVDVSINDKYDTDNNYTFGNEDYIFHDSSNNEIAYETIEQKIQEYSKK